jgi:23S rRNA (cytosine1962-C5)-methyltransferase
MRSPQPKKRNSMPAGKRTDKRRKTFGQKLPGSLALECGSAAELPQIILAKATSHPNIYRKRIARIEGAPRIGDYVQVLCPAAERQQPEPGESPPPATELTLMGYGWYNPKSEIAVRVVRWEAEIPDGAYWQQLIERAVSLRTEMLRLDRDTDCYRVLHAEADGFPGLVVDRYGDCLSAELFSAAAAPRVERILELLSVRLGTQHWLIQPGPHLQSQEGFEVGPRASENLPSQVTVHEHGVRFLVEFDGSHKTGFFCDQRENRQRLAQFCEGGSVLDLCCYTGGFAVTAAKLGRPGSVTGVDLDAAPLMLARRNAGLNQIQVKFTQADAFAYMRDMLRSSRTFDVVVLDPPKLIRNRAELEEGTRKHFDLNRLAMQLVRPGGLLLTCSCAGLLSAHEFTRLVRAAARSAFQPTDFNPHPTPRLAGGQIWFKREDVNHTGAHKINNTLGQALLTLRMGKRG